MKTLKTLPTLLLTLLLAALLAGCGGDNSASQSSQPTSGTSGGQANQPTTASSGSSGSNNPGAGSSGNSAFNPADLQIVTTASYTSPLGLYYYIGVVKNNGSATLKDIQPTLVDDSGNTIPQDKAPETDLTRVILPPGSSAGFNLQYDQLIGKPSYKFTAQVVNPGDTLQPAKISLVNDKLGAGNMPKSQKITGEIKNDSDKNAILWTVNVMGYDASGKLVEVTSGTSLQNAAAQGGFKAHGTLQFEANLGSGNPYGNKGATVAKYDLFASGFQNPLGQ